MRPQQYDRRTTPRRYLDSPGGPAHRKQDGRSLLRDPDLQERRRRQRREPEERAAGDRQRS
jgi:hypothetical protein